MNPTTTSLGKLNDSCRRRTRKLKERLKDLDLQTNERRDGLVASTTIDAAWLWTRFLRSYYLSACFGAKTYTGMKVKTNLSLPTEDAALRHAILQYTGKKFTLPRVPPFYEPKWFNANSYLKLYTSLGTANVASVTAAFSIQTLFFSSLQDTRNFYAHRGENTALKAIMLAGKVGLPQIRGLHLTEVLCFKAPGDAVELISSWLYDLELVVDQLCA